MKYFPRFYWDRGKRTAIEYKELLCPVCGTSSKNMEKGSESIVLFCNCGEHYSETLTHGDSDEDLFSQYPDVFKKYGWDEQTMKNISLIRIRNTTELIRNRYIAYDSNDAQKLSDAFCSLVLVEIDVQSKRVYLGGSETDIDIVYMGRQQSD